MASTHRLPLLLAILLPMTSAAAQTAPNGGDAPPDDTPTPTPLTVGSLLMASDANLVVDRAGVSVGSDQVQYVYHFRNKGSAPLSLAANVTMPDLEVSADGRSTYALPAPAPDNPVSLVVKADNQPVTTTPTVQAIALGIDRIADLNAEHIPLVPFAADTDKALATAKPETIAKLASLGVVSPRDPTQPTLPAMADWSLRVIQGWTLTLAPSATTVVTVGFKPIKASYSIDKDSLAGFKDLKDQICLTPKTMAALESALKPKSATVDVLDFTVATAKPVRWVDSPAMTIQVRKPKPASIVVFCGIEAASAGEPLVKGKSADDGSGDALRVMIFSPSAP